MTRKRAMFDEAQSISTLDETRRRLKRIKFTEVTSRHMCDRIHWITPDEIRVVLSRLPIETWTRLRAVHFNDRWCRRRLGYVNQGRREIAICALPPRFSLTRWLLPYRRHTPRLFGAIRGAQWPPLTIRRFMLYEVFLHELGHLQVIDADAKSVRRKFAMETRAQDFADYWREVLWSEPFSHRDPVHNPPNYDEVDAHTWDKQIESDVAAGRLDEFANEALREHEASPSTEL